MRVGLATVIFTVTVSAAHAQPIVVSRQAWQGLSPEERTIIQSKQVVDVREGSSYGEVLDAQGIDESTPGTNGGAALGAAIGNAAYIDRAFKPDNNYSAKTQLAAILLGAAIGSSLDKPAQAQYRFRYAIRLPNGDIEYREITQTDPFRHPPGVCLDLNSLEKTPQSLCAVGADGLRARFLRDATSTSLQTTPTAEVSTDNIPAETKKSESPIQCKPANLATITTTREKCLIINGEVL